MLNHLLLFIAHGFCLWCLKISSRNNGKDMMPPVIFFVSARSAELDPALRREQRGEKNSNSPFFHHPKRKGAGPWFYSSIPPSRRMQYEMADGQPPLQMPVIAGRVVVVVAVVVHGCRHIVVGRTESLITASRCDQHGHKAGGSNNNILTRRRRATELKLSTLWPQKTKGDRLLYVLNNKIVVCRRKD